MLLLHRRFPLVLFFPWVSLPRGLVGRQEVSGLAAHPPPRELASPQLSPAQSEPFLAGQCSAECELTRGAANRAAGLVGNRIPHQATPECLWQEYGRINKALTLEGLGCHRPKWGKSRPLHILPPILAE